MNLSHDKRVFSHDEKVLLRDEKVLLRDEKVLAREYNVLAHAEKVLAREYNASGLSGSYLFTHIAGMLDEDRSCRSGNLLRTRASAFHWRRRSFVPKRQLIADEGVRVPLASKIG